MSVIKKENKFVSYLIILVALFILFLFTIDQYEKLQENLDIKSELTNDINEKREQIEKNDKIKAEMKVNEKSTNKFLIEFKEDELIDYIYSYLENSDSIESRIEIKSINLSEPMKNELGFSEVDINLSVVVGNEDALKRFLDFFNSADSKYNIFIDNFTYPNDGRTGSFNIDLPLKIFYK